MFGRDWNKLSDEALMEALQKGKMRALEALYRRYQERLRYYFYRMNRRNAEVAEDMIQDLFVKVAEKPHLYRKGARVRTWLFSIANNMCKNAWRDHDLHRQKEEAIHASLTEAAPSDADAIRQLNTQDFERLLNQALEGVEQERTATFLLRFREELSLQEIAEVMDCPIGTVKSRIHYTLRYLEQALTELKPVNSSSS